MARLGLGVLALALAAWLLTPTNLLNTYDQHYALVWGRDLSRLDLPDYAALGAATPHPLTVLLSALIVPIAGGSAFEVLEFVNVLAWAVAVGAVVFIGWELLSLPAGLVGGSVVAVSPVFFELMAASSADCLLVALLLVAAAIEVRRPRVGVPVLVTLLVAGLVRPEAWGFAAVYALYVLVSDRTANRAVVVALAAGGPLLWALSDLIVTGDPLFSLTKTQAGAEAAARPTGIAEIPPQLRAGLAELSGRAELLGTALAAAVLLVARRWAALAPAAVVVLSVAAFAMLGVAELPMLPRYLLVGGALLAAAAGWSLLAWRETALSRTARLAAGAGALVVLALLAQSFSERRARFEGNTDAHERRARLQAQIETAAAQVRDCPLRTGDYRLTSALAYAADRSLEELTRAPDGSRAAVVVPAGATAKLYGTTPEAAATAAVPGAVKQWGGSEVELWAAGCG